jgi:hypothetical protein
MKRFIRAMAWLVPFLLACAGGSPEIVTDLPLRNFETSVSGAAGTVKFLSDSLGVVQVVAEAVAYPAGEAQTKEAVGEQVVQNLYGLLVHHFQYLHGSVTRDSAVIRDCLEKSIGNTSFRTGYQADGSAHLGYSFGQSTIGDIIRCMQTSAGQ